MLTSLQARAPVRVDFGGGWTDVPPYCDAQGGFVCNLAIARYVTATLTQATDGDGPSDDSGEHALARAALRRAARNGLVPPRLRLESDFPVGAGLGGSSAAGVAAVGALAAWRGERPHPAELAEASRAIEVEDLGVAGGRQDHYAAAFGGALALEFGGGVRVRRIALSAETLAALEASLLVLYTGRSRISGATITAVLDAYGAREPRVVQALARMQALARQMAAALESGDLPELGRLVGETWVHQRALHPAITTPEIDAIVDAASRVGAWGTKALGASGGGCVLVLGEPECLTRVVAATRALATVLPCSADLHGFHVVTTTAPPARDTTPA